MVDILLYVASAVWIGFGAFSLYTAVRDDMRNEKKLKGKDK